MLQPEAVLEPKNEIPRTARVGELRVYMFIFDRHMSNVVQVSAIRTTTWHDDVHDDSGMRAIPRCAPV